METIRLALSAKQHASLKKGRKVRLNAGHMSGSGMQYIVRPETFDRLSRSFSLRKGIDLALDPSEIQASMMGGKVNIKQGISDSKKISRYIGSVFKPLNKNLKPVKEAMTQGAVDQIRLATNPNQVYLEQAQQVDAILNPYIQPYLPDEAPVSAPVSNIAIAAAQAAIANSYQPFAPPVSVKPPSQIGLIDTEYSRPTLASHVGYGLRHGAIEAPGRPFHSLHPARFSSQNDVGFMQQIPQIYKDAARIASGRGLHL